MQILEEDHMVMIVLQKFREEEKHFFKTFFKSQQILIQLWIIKSSSVSHYIFTLAFTLTCT